LIRSCAACAGVCTVKAEVPELVAWVESPLYIAVMVTEPGVVDGVYVTVQLPEDSVHGRPLKVPPALPSLQLTVPLGVVAVPEEVSATVAVNVIVFPIMTVADPGNTVVLVVRRVTVSVDDPELVKCVASGT